MTLVTSPPSLVGSRKHVDSSCLLLSTWPRLVGCACYACFTNGHLFVALSFCISIYQINAEFQRITTLQLEPTFMSALDRYTPKLLGLFRAKGGALGETLKSILGLLEVQYLEWKWNGTSSVKQGNKVSNLPWKRGGCCLITSVWGLFGTRRFSTTSTI